METSALDSLNIQEVFQKNILDIYKNNSKSRNNLDKSEQLAIGNGKCLKLNLEKNKEENRSSQSYCCK